MATRSLLLEHAYDRDLTQLDEYRAVGGYAALETARGMEPDAVLDQLITSNLRGRGGAGFPTGRKASLVDRSGAKPSYLVVNADESEPGAFKDREIMFRNPHLLVEGCLIAARAIASHSVFIYIRGEYLVEYEVLQRAVDDALRTDERAREVRADLDHVPSDWLEVVHVVEARDRLAVRGCQVECLRDLAHCLGRQPAMCFLCQPECGHDR